MEPRYLLIIGAIAIILIGLYIYKRKSHRAGFHRVKTQNRDAQMAYMKGKPSDKSESLSLEERIERSWEFLTIITTKIIEKFSRDDIDSLRLASQKLQKHGMVYYHDVNLEVDKASFVAKSSAKQLEEQDLQKGSNTGSRGR